MRIGFSTRIGRHLRVSMSAPVRARPRRQVRYQPQPFTSPGTALLDSERLGESHSVELYKDGVLWIIDHESPPIEIKLDVQAALRLRDFLLRHT